MSDGAIIFDTKIDNSGFEAGIKGIKTNLERATKSVGNLSKETQRAWSGMSSQQIGLVNRIEQTKNTIDGLKSKINSLESAKVPTTKYKILQDEFARLDAKLASLNEKEQRMLDRGASKKSKSYQGLQRELEVVGVRYDKVIAKMEAMQAQNKAFTTAGPTEASMGLREKLQSQENSYTQLTKRLEEMRSKQDATSRSLEKMSGAMHAGGSSAKSFTKGLLRIGTLLKLRVLRGVVTAIFNGVKNGFNNLAQYSGKLNDSMSSLKSSFTQFNNSLATAFAPIIQSIVPMIEAVINKVTEAINVLAQFTAKIFGNSDTFIRAKKTNEDYAKSLAKTNKEQKKMASFDTVAQLSGKSENGATSSQNMFEEVKIDVGIDEKATKIKDVIDGFIKSINFDKLKASFENLKESFMPFASTIGEGTLWLLNNILAPLASWTINDVIPLFLDALSAGLEVLNNILIALQPMGKWLWDNLLYPIAQWTGGVIVSILEWIVKALEDFSNWINENQELVENIAIVITSFAVAIGLVTLAIGIWNGICAIATGVTTAFAGAVAFLTSPIGLVILALGALITIVVLIIKYWDEIKIVAGNCWDWICEKWSQAGEWFNNNVVTPISNFFGGLWKGIKTGASVLATFMKTKVIDPIVKIFKGLYNTLIGIVEGIINGFIGIINGFIKGINLAIDCINAIPGVSLPSLKLMKEVQIPRLATGTVVPANYGEFTAVLGDNKREVEVVSPLSTMKQAFIEALSETGGQNVTINFEESSIGDLVRLLKPYIDKEGRRIGRTTRLGGAY